MGNKASHSESEDAAAAAAASAAASTASSSAARPPQARRGPDDDGEDPLVEVPPPMQPISSVPLSEEMTKKVRMVKSRRDWIVRDLLNLTG